MKLNNKGWGTAEMFLLSGGLLIALLVAIFFIAKLYGSLENATGNRRYFELETSLESAAKEYVIQNNIKISSTTRISYNTLNKLGFIDEFVDSKGRSCTGYVVVNVIDNIPQYDGYISCPDYQTKNY